MGDGATSAEPNRLRSDEDILSADLPDAALEAASRAVTGTAMSFPNAPTVNILVICCNFE